MWPLERHLRAAGYNTLNLDYPSRGRSLPQLAEFLAEALDRAGASNYGRLHFVTHSMGGIVVRGYLRDFAPPNLGRVVMLAPPNNGTEVVDRFGAQWWFTRAFGPAVSSLGTGPDSYPSQIGPAEFDLGVIMGRRSINPIASWMIDGPDDGMVSVESAKLDGMRDFRLLDRSHSFIMLARDVADEAVHFLRHGAFTGTD